MPSAKKTQAKAGLKDNCIAVFVGSKVIHVPSDKFQAALVAGALVHEGVDMLRDQMKKWRDSDAVMAPKEIKDMAEAIKNLSSQVREIAVDFEPKASERPEEKVAEKTDIDFEQLDDGKPKGSASATDDSGPESSVSGEAADESQVLPFQQPDNSDEVSGGDPDNIQAP